MNEADIYKESCTMLRHYSNSSLTIRVVLIAQGIIVLSGGGYLFRTNEFKLAAIAAAFGLLFTIVLLLLHKNYQNKCNIFIKVAADIEGCIENTTNRAMQVCDADHKNRNNNITGEIFDINGFFYFMILAFAGLLLSAIFIR